VVDLVMDPDTDSGVDPDPQSVVRGGGPGPC
jgi:hypothetical protein